MKLQLKFDCYPYNEVENEIYSIIMGLPPEVFKTELQKKT